jgi:hypothetical protein
VPFDELSVKWINSDNIDALEMISSEGKLDNAGGRAFAFVSFVFLLVAAAFSRLVAASFSRIYTNPPQSCFV